ncbi:putative carboxylesterase [Lupinus albus]|uniref:Putative carboxylesterase n=1 Tax=Lupinus albus TaxID=3870 RepID=A0A6A4R0P7_LUPAL|nr:putative carboxylesterase [Lupinus albus]
MVKQNQSIMALLPLFLILAISTEVEGAKLFVFGDSYVDTGNFLNSPSYKPPYGITFPGYPAGRFGNGHVLTDYLGKFISPLFALFIWDH